MSRVLEVGTGHIGTAMPEYVYWVVAVDVLSRDIIVKSAQIALVKVFFIEKGAQANLQE